MHTLVIDRSSTQPTSYRRPMVALGGSWRLRAFSMAIEKCCCSPGVWISHMNSGISWRHTVAIKPLDRNRSYCEVRCSPLLVAWWEFWHSSIAPSGTIDDGRRSAERLSTFLASATWQAAALSSSICEEYTHLVPWENHLAAHKCVLAMLHVSVDSDNHIRGSERRGFSMVIPEWCGSYQLLYIISPYWPSKTLRAPRTKIWAGTVTRGLAIQPTTFLRWDSGYRGSHIGWRRIHLCITIVNVNSDCWVTVMCHPWKCAMLWSMCYQGYWQWCICIQWIHWGQNLPFKLYFYSVS